MSSPLTTLPTDLETVAVFRALDTATVLARRPQMTTASLDRAATSVHHARCRPDVILPWDCTDVQDLYLF